MTKLVLFDGIVYDISNYETLTKNYGIFDERISKFNVLMLKAYKFERIFVFYDKKLSSTKDSIMKG